MELKPNTRVAMHCKSTGAVVYGVTCTRSDSSGVVDVSWYAETTATGKDVYYKTPIVEREQLSHTMILAARKL